ncbi:MAG: hypothetical protein ACRDNZ_20720 [Streptosporangiaceae bacterium]
MSKPEPAPSLGDQDPRGGEDPAGRLVQSGDGRSPSRCGCIELQFSQRRQAISELTAVLAAAFIKERGYAPDARALGRLRQWANHASRVAKDGEPLDLAAEELRRADGRSVYRPHSATR